MLNLCGGLQALHATHHATTEHKHNDMKKIGIFYGSTTGTTAGIAAGIGRRLGVDPKDIHDVAETAPSKTGDYDVIILGASTRGAGDLQEDMATFVDGLAAIDLRGTLVALFGCGDESMADTFCNSVGEMYHRLHDTHAQFFAPFDNDPYSYSSSKSDFKGMTLGLCIDQDNRPELTEPRLDAWCEAIRQEII